MDTPFVEALLLLAEVCVAHLNEAGLQFMDHSLRYF